MSTPPSPVVASWELALRLKRRREQLGIEVRTITETLGFTRNYWSAIENERKILSTETLARIVELFEFDNEEKEELFALRTAAKERGWWTRYPALFDDEIQRLFGLEQGARSMRSYENLLIPGLLQTAEYIEAIMMPDVTMRPVEVDQRVEVRLRRQERLTDERNPFTFTAVISEAALRQQIGGPRVLRAQLGHLAGMIEQHPDTLDVRVIPFTATACGLFGGATVVLIDFDNPQLPTVAWQETVTAWGVIDDPNQVRDLTTTYEDAYRRALSKKETLRMIHHHSKELG
ncbi:Scr1 family TA system antitoxin-like transcriptional regulator [Amycolatopsis sp. DG1A-15b]|uniref:Scr1 family TA system antitoxin-like transcriptional regulator n=1 Tax=Amycolatopsis sp. DG1A-15b TaxID=3052846 RepID=UPI00255BAFD1|nr:Scr1 family TA system antitoxin-like transcriptional regulator [Amycolatopsis sp. DG1A-15b]WIX88168.1 Scr1 family TA system antitoxin-like transcriptional regulator [Amycolatopsis sp. DG1A-15b]